MNSPSQGMQEPDANYCMLGADGYWYDPNNHSSYFVTFEITRLFKEKSYLWPTATRVNDLILFYKHCEMEIFFKEVEKFKAQIGTIWKPKSKDEVYNDQKAPSSLDIGRSLQLTDPSVSGRSDATSGFCRKLVEYTAGCCRRLARYKSRS